MTAPSPALGIDFGTSNSAVACVDAGGEARLLPLEGAATTLPSAVFFNAEDRTVHFGRDAVALYLAGVDGRLLRSLKSLLGSALMRERTAVGTGEMSFQDIVTRFLAELRERATRQLGTVPGRVVMGRPVHFVDDAPERDRQAQDDLRAAATAAGWADAAFELEPIAAAFDYERRLAREALVLVVDVGGGTSDFTVVRLGPGRSAQADRRADILATAGVHVAGTDFDRRLNLAQVMPLLGLGHHSAQGREVPSRVFMDLATWHLIPFLATPRRMSEAAALRTNYADLRLHDRLMAVLRQRLGHGLADAVEQAKVHCSDAGVPAFIDLGTVETGLAAQLTPDGLTDSLHGLLQQVCDCALACVQRAGVAPQRLDAVYLTGGSSALRPLQQQLLAALPGVPLVEGDLFGGVAAGLAYAAGQR